MSGRLETLFAPAVMERLTLVANHVVGAEPAATARLVPHAGRTVTIAVGSWPALLPRPPASTFRVTPAGLLEWCGGDAPAVVDLTLTVEAANPAALVARVLAGEPPAVSIVGDATLAGDVNWLVQNLRWDVGADLDRLFGPVVAEPLTRAGRAFAAGLRLAIQGIDRVRSRFG
jgi:ubiquinone biosynthesis protein UbiJ